MSKYLLFLLATLSVNVHSQTVGWFYSYPGAAEGYVLFAPGESDTTYLLDKCGKRVHEWGSQYQPGLAVYLLEDGTLLRCGDANNNQFMGGGHGGILEKIDWDGNILWSYKISDNLQCQHHDAIQLPNGNIVALVWEYHTKAEAQSMGRVSMGPYMWSEKIVEVQPVGTDSGIIVWQWRAWDHLIQDVDSTKPNYGVIKEHPELLDINLGSLDNFNVDWLHFNSLDYRVDLDQLLISCHELSEVYIIDHSTDLTQAASHSGGKSGHGGDFLYRWGNPANYDRGTSDDKKFFEQHNAHWIPAGYPGEGSIMVFNNGINRPGTDYSTIETFIPPIAVNYNYPLEPDSAYEPDEQNWIYSASPPVSLFSFVQGGAQRLANGNTMICDAKEGRFVEIDDLGNTVWQYINPVDVNGNTPQGSQPFMNSCFRVTYLPLDYPGLAGKDLTPGTPIEINPLPYTCVNIPTAVHDPESDDDAVAISPNPFQEVFEIQISSNVRNPILTVHDVAGKLLLEENNIVLSDSQPIKVNVAGYKGVVVVTLYENHGVGRRWQTIAISN